MYKPDKSRTHPFEIAHVNYHTSRLTEMKAWYLTLLEGETVFSNDDYAFLTYDQDFHRIALIRDPKLRDKSGLEAAAHHAAFAYDSLEELIHTYERLAEKGIRPVRIINHGPTISLYYRDPDGNQAELQVNNFASMTEILKFLKTGRFAADPIGVEFNIHRFIERFRQGATKEDLFHMTYEGELS